MNEQELKKQLNQEIKQDMKNSIRKKGIIIFAIILIVIVGIFEYYITHNGINSKIHKQYTYEEISQYKEEIPITMENWKDYITTEDTTIENKDNFGEVTSKYEQTALKLKDNICGYVILEVKVSENKDNENQIITIIGGKNENILKINGEIRNEGNVKVYNNKFTLDDLNLVQIKGYIYTIDIPEEIWITDKNTGEKYMYVEDCDTLYKDQKKYEHNNYIYSLSNMEYEKYKVKTGK